MGKDKIFLKADTDTHTLVVNGKQYRIKEYAFKKDGHMKDVEYVEFDAEVHKQRVQKIADFLESNTDGLNTNKILVEVINQLPLKSLSEIEKRIQKGDKPKIKSGCLNIDIGGKELHVC